MYVKKVLSAAIAALLIASVGMITAVQADVEIDVDTVGDVDLTITTTPDGTLSIIYNGRDLLAEINSLRSSLVILRPKLMWVP